MITKHQNQLEITRKLISIVLENCVELHELSADDRHELDLQEAENKSPRSIVGEIEVYDIYLAGYATQIIKQHFSFEPHTKKELAQRTLLSKPYIANWFFSSRDGQSKLKQYVLNLHYLQLLISAYLTTLENTIE